MYAPHCDGSNVLSYTFDSSVLASWQCERDNGLCSGCCMSLRLDRTTGGGDGGRQCQLVTDKAGFDSIMSLPAKVGCSVCRARDDSLRQLELVPRNPRAYHVNVRRLWDKRQYLLSEPGV